MYSGFIFILFLFVKACLAIAAVSADPYTIGQVNAGVPALRAALSGQPGVITGISYGNGIVQGHLGNADHYNVAPYTYNAAPVAYSGYAAPVAYGGYAAPVAYSGAHYLGKRAADSDADAYTIGQVAAGLPYANAVATGHAHNPGYIAYTSYPASSVHTSYHASPLSYAVPSVYSHGVYNTSPYVHALGKRDADADADAYTIGQVAAGLPYANAVATGHAHNPGYFAYTSFPASSIHRAYNAVPVAHYAYGGYAAPFYG